ncbi:MAG TPA: GspH/FimT family pseudopilin [Gammaproteobacteria bacterium]
MKTMRGFTLIELIVVVAIFAITITLAIPNFRLMVATNRQATGANMLISSFQLARSEAITRSQSVRITATNGNWVNGWSIDVVDDGTNIQRHEAMAPQFNIASTATAFTYSPQGRLAIAPPQTIDLCDDRTGEIGRRLTLEPIGRVSVSQLTCP